MKPGKATASDARELFDQLHGRGFTKAKNIRMQPRKVRQICSDFPEHFLSTQRGYKCVVEASDAEIEVAVRDLRSRSAHLNRRANALDSVIGSRRQNKMQLEAARAQEKNTG